MRFDDIDLLRAIDRHEDAASGAELWSLSGLRLMEELAGGIVTDTNLHRGFVREIHNARDGGLLTFRVYSQPNGELPSADRDAYYYIQQVHTFALTSTGRDQARGRWLTQPVPDSAEDDGRPISQLILAEVAESIEAGYRPAQRPIFFAESGVPLERIPQLPEGERSNAAAVLSALDEWGSEGRRVLRGFLGSWLDDRLPIGPDAAQRIRIAEQLARQGWYAKDGRLVVGDRAGNHAVNSATVESAWSPLSRRSAGLVGDVMVEGVPEWLYPQLQAWMFHVLQYTDGPIAVLRPGQGVTEDSRQIMLRIRTATHPWLIPADDPAFLDALDATVRWGTFDHHGMTEYGDPDALEKLLTAANSVWRVSANRRGLERRIDPTVTAATIIAQQSANAEAAEHLAVAREAAYGLNPDPDKAYDEAVLAVEALACPLVCPTNSRRTLGTVVRDLRSQLDQCELASSSGAGQPAAVDSLVAMIGLLWDGQSRHAGSANSRHQTQNESEAAFHLAATLVQWLSTGVLRRNTL
jgi:hypothetical protein